MRVSPCYEADIYVQSIKRQGEGNHVDLTFQRFTRQGGAGSQGPKPELKAPMVSALETTM